MNTILYTELNGFALIVLLLIFLNVRRGPGKLMLEQRLYLVLIQAAGAILVLDSFMWILDGRTGFGMRESLMAATFLYYFLSPVICMIWYAYVHYQVFSDQRRLKKAFLPLLIPFLINAVCSVLSLYYPLSFYLDDGNKYHRGPFFYVLFFCSYLYLIFAPILLIRKRKAIRPNVFIPLLLFSLAPIISGTLQALYYGLSIIWISVTVSILIIFINLQNDQLYTDYLTGLYNRRQLDAYLHHLAQDPQNRISGIMLDINSFKQINDTYGHIIGDQALRHLSEILRTTFHKKDFISRYGGDEFVIIAGVDGREALYGSIKRLHAALSDFNRKGELPFELTVSVGCDSVSAGELNSTDEFLRRIDTLMYRDKSGQLYSE